MKIRNLLFLNVAFLALFSAGGDLLAADATGDWTWTTPGRNGGEDRVSVLSLKADGSALSGKLSTPGRDGKPTERSIVEGKLDGDSISFKVIREAGGASITNSYSGKISGGAITGTIEFTRNGALVTRKWEAKTTGAPKQTAAAKTPAKPGYDAQGRKIVNETKYKDISVADAEKYLAAHPDAIVLDLRPAKDFAAGHLPNAKNYDTSDEAKYKDILSPLDKTKRYLVYSVVGHFREVRALEYFEANGFEHAAGLLGGYTAWVAAGKTTTK
jgi:rhodanese-related sulfurtransferase